MDVKKRVLTKAQSKWTASPRIQRQDWAVTGQGGCRVGSQESGVQPHLWVLPLCAPVLVTHGSLSFLNYKIESITQGCQEDPKRECLSCACLSKDWVPKSQNLSTGRTLNIKPAPGNRGGKCLSLFSISLSLSVSDLKLHFSLQSALSSSFRLASPTVCLLPQPPTTT